MRQRGPDRQWTAEELLAILREERGEELPPWCPDAWSLVSLLCVRPELRRLGRKAFALPGAAADGALLIDTVVELLARRGAAMAEDDLKAELHRVRGFSSTTWAVLRRSPPLVRLGDGTIGLSPRDVPGGPAAIARASRAAHSKLLWTQAAMNARELHRVVARLGPPIDAWSPKLLQCVLRQVGGFTFEPGGHVGLAVWGR
jgi:hypothetical protein